MTPEQTNEVTIGLFVFVLFCAFILSTGIVISLVAIGHRRRRHAPLLETPVPAARSLVSPPRLNPAAFENPCRWLAIRSSNLSAAQSVLRLANPTPCSWDDGISKLNDRSLFISPPIKGWILVVGLGLPDPADDVDQCYHFILKVSRELGQVQFFSANRVVNYHAWIRADGGRIVRGYAWAGETLWNQGARTQAEIDLGLKCFDYGEEAVLSAGSSESHQANAEKINFLAARWSLDPTSIDHTMLPADYGIAGDFIANA
jgi:hypothetical protein